MGRVTCPAAAAVLVAWLVKGVAGNYALGDTAPMCWQLDSANTPIRCPNELQVDWIDGGLPQLIPVSMTLTVKVSLNITKATLEDLAAQGLLSSSNLTVDQKWALCTQGSGSCPSDQRSADECCYFHVNVHSCLNKPGSFCGPWIGNDGRLATHTPAQAGFAGTTGKEVFNFDVRLFWEGSYTVIAHFKFAGMHFAIGTTREVAFSDALCPLPTVPNATGLCEACPIGSQPLSLGIPRGGRQMTDDEAAVQGWNPLCILCPPGWYSSDGTECKETEPGYYQHVEGQDRQLPCASGTANPLRGMTMCLACNPGQYATGAAELCSLCAKGTYTIDSGSAHCTACPGVRTTDSMGSTQIGQCLCPPRTYAPPGHADAWACANCSAEASCEGLGAIPKALPGFYLHEVGRDSLSIFQCRGDAKRCPGGGVGACPAGRSGVACAICADRHVEQSDGTCGPCGGGDTVLFSLAVVGCAIALAMVYVIAARQDRSTQSHATVLVSTGLAQIIGIVQMLSVMGSLRVAWPSSVTGILSHFAIAKFDIDTVKLGCIMGYDPVLNYSFRVLVVLTFFWLLFTVHGVRLLFQGKGLKQEWSALVGACGACTAALFVSICMAALSPFQCQTHPNGAWTMIGYEAERCWDGDLGSVQESMIGIAVAAMLFVFAFLSGMTWLVVTYPKQIKKGNVQFLNATAFLFSRFKPEGRGVALAILIRGLLMALIPAIPDIMTQLFGVLIVFLITITVSSGLMPFRFAINNLVEYTAGSCFIMMVVVGAAYATQARDVGLVGDVGAAVVFVAMLATLVPILRGCFLRLLKRTATYQFFLSHHNAAACAMTRLLKMQLQGNPKVKNDVFLDSDNLLDLDTLLDTVSHNCGVVVALCTRDYLERPWCLAEVVISHANKVPMFPIRFDSFEAPDKDWIAQVGDNVDLYVLTEKGLSLDATEAALTWFAALPHVRFCGRLTNVALQKLTDKIVTNDISGAVDSRVNGFAHMKSDDKLSAQAVVQKPYILADVDNWEAAAAAMVLSSLAGKLMPGEPQPLVFGCEGGDLTVAHMGMAVLLLTKGCFSSRAVALGVFQAMDQYQICLPVLAEASFPTMTPEDEQALDHLAAEHRAAADGHFTGDDVRFYLTNCFRQIAIDFTPSKDASTLNLQAGRLVDRLRRGQRQQQQQQTAPQGTATL